MSGEKQNDFKYSKDSGHLPLFGVGPIYVTIIGGLTALTLFLNRFHGLPVIRPVWGELLFAVSGAALGISGIVLWIRAVLWDRVVDKIVKNHLATSGAYACVRNPIYSAFLMLFSGILLINGNALTFVLPFLYWGLMTVLMKITEEKWLSERYGAEYAAYCRKVNRCIPGIPDRDALYESDISNARWIAYDLPGNVGWILYFTGLIRVFAKKPALMDSTVLFQMMIVAIIPALLMIIGIIELISERVQKLDRTLPRFRLWRGFGALTLGGVMGTVVTVIMLVCAAINGLNGRLCLWLMLAGGILCGVFAGLLLRRYKRK